MRSTILCRNCGEQVSVRLKHDSKMVRCPACGSVHSRPETGPEDDDNPYGIAADPEQKSPCPKCTKPVLVGAIVCNHCGFNRETGSAFERVYEKVDWEWEAGLPFLARFGIFFGLETLILLTMLVVGLGEKGLVAWVPSWSFACFMGAFILGTYSRVNLFRGKKGKIKLKTTWRFCFLPLKTVDVRWHEYGSVVTEMSRPADIWEWLVAASLIPLGLIPAIAWWYFIIRANQFDVALRNDSAQALVLYRGRSEAMAKEIAATIRGVTGMQ